MPSAEHDRLVLIGARWLKKNGFGVVMTELTFAGKGEKPDVLGFRSTCSAIIEVKVSRADFFADAKKPWRNGEPSLGVYRYYLCPQGLIREEDIPERWGLLYEHQGKVSRVIGPEGNLWPAYGNARIADNPFLAFQHKSCCEEERGALYSIARRLQK
jgi:hypothetical protein